MYNSNKQQQKTTTTTTATNNNDDDSSVVIRIYNDKFFSKKHSRREIVKLKQTPLTMIYNPAEAL